MTSSSDDQMLEGPVVRFAGVVAVEGMPGAGKTTAMTVLADRGHTVLGEYTDDHARSLTLAAHPHHDDEHPHLANWLRKDSQARRLARASCVVMDRNWLTALGWAASVGGLPDRAGWAYSQLIAGRLILPERWIILDCTVETSLTRRREHLDLTHPWARTEPLDRLRAFYSDPAAAVRPALHALADALATVPVMRIDAEADRDTVGRAICEATP
ncbi:AAA family ATPase [Antribacter gilvus]|uniref:AAA family ATPase n=1 Tax=Antribacter gilvus TaxID=2304675 RepID=UPI000F778F30